MIEDPVALTIRRNIERTPSSLVDAFRGAPTSFLADASNGGGCLHYSIKPIAPAQSVVGTAVTCWGGPRDLLAAMAVMDFAGPGDVLVLATEQDESGAVIGDNYLAMCKLRGIAGIVTDGLARDIAGLLEVGLPVFSRGICPNSGFRNGPGTINMPVSIGGLIVEPGDIIVGDADGVVVVPKAKAEFIAQRLEKVKELEAASQKRIAAGERRSFWNPAKIEQRGGVKYID